MSFRIAMIGIKGLPNVPGGVERHVEELSQRIVEKGHAVTAYVREKYTLPGMNEWKGIKLQRVPCISTKHFEAITYSLMATLHAVFIDRNFTHYHYHGVGPSLVSWIPRVFATRAKVITTFHCRDSQHGKWNAIARFFLRLGEWTAVMWSHLTIAVSRTIRDYCQQNFGRDVVYVPNGVSSLKGASTEILERFGLTSQAYGIVISRLVSHKDIETVIHAWEKKDAVPLSIPLVIVGGSSHTDTYASYLYSLASSRVKFLGPQSGEVLASLLTHARVFISASRAEGLPISVLEALACGVPTILSDIPEHREIATEAHETGKGIVTKFFLTGSSESLRKEIDSELARDEDSLRIQVRSAEAFVQECYNWNMIADRIEHIYESVSHEKKKLEHIPHTIARS